MEKKAGAASKNNTLLVKDDVGKAKPATRKLPPEGFAFGKPDQKDQEGAGLGKLRIPHLN